MNKVVKIIIDGEDKTGSLSDGYHTFDELYEHRYELFIALCKVLDGRSSHKVWRSKFHSDGTSWEGQFVLGIGTAKGKQITYHLPLSRWDETSFAFERKRAPKWDGHTSKDALKRLKCVWNA